MTAPDTSRPVATPPEQLVRRRARPTPTQAQPEPEAPAEPAPSRGVMKSAARFALFPLIRTTESLTGVGSRLMNTYEGVREAREKAAQKRQAQATLKGTPRQRFELVRAKGGWSEAELLAQEKGYRRAKWAVIITATITLAVTAYAAFAAPVWMLMFLLPAGIVLTGYSLTQAVRHPLLLQVLQ